jgi:hypothetical protein
MTKKIDRERLYYLIKEGLEPLIAVVNAKLFKGIHEEDFKPEDV